MTVIELLLLGVALGAIPVLGLARLVVVGVEPKEVRQYNDATDENSDE